MSRFTAFAPIVLSLGLLGPAADGAHGPDESATVAILGSSVAAGWVTSREAKHDLGNGWAARLGRLVESRGVRVVNVSVPGDDTRAVLERMGQDLERVDPDFVLIALSLGNEGLEEDRGRARASFRSGLQRIIERCLDEGRLPVLGLCYPYDGYDAEDYAAVQETNLWMQSLGHPCINLLGPVDDGEGHFAAGHTYDEGHPDSRGHEAMFRTVVPSLFAAVFDGQPVPERPGGEYGTAVDADDGPAPLSHVPDDVIESFAASFRVEATGAGAVAAVRTTAGFAGLAIDDEGRVVYASPTGATIRGPVRVLDGIPHDVTLSHRHLLGRTDSTSMERASASSRSGSSPCSSCWGARAATGRLRPLRGTATGGSTAPP